jgi:hypothetical protein
MRFRFIEDRRADYPVTIICGVLGVSPADADPLLLYRVASRCTVRSIFPRPRLTSSLRDAAPATFWRPPPGHPTRSGPGRAQPA